MNKNLTEIIFILDRSGSMAGLESDTIGGFNGLIRKQKQAEGEAFVTTVLFNHNTEILHNRLPVADIPDMTDKDYAVRGCTALLDAVGESVARTDLIQKHVREEDRPAKTMVVITTDGLENASSRYTYADVKALIEAQKVEGWEFVFLGANIDAAEEAQRIGIAPSRAVNFVSDEEGTALNFKTLNKAVGAVRKSEDAMAMAAVLEDGACFDEIRADYAKRK